MKALFEIGQRVCCVDSGNCGNPNGKSQLLIEGKCYTVKGINQCICGSIGIDVGLTNSDDRTICLCSHIENGIWHNQYRFIPLQTDGELEDQIRESLNEHLRVKI